MINIIICEKNKMFMRYKNYNFVIFNFLIYTYYIPLSLINPLMAKAPYRGVICVIASRNRHFSRNLYPHRDF